MPLVSIVNQFVPVAALYASLMFVQQSLLNTRTTIDGQGNIFTVGIAKTSPYNILTITKVSSIGQQLWSKQVTVNNHSNLYYMLLGSLHCDSTGNLYIPLNYRQAAGDRVGVLWKIAGNGAVLNADILNNGSTSVLGSVATDPEGNVYVSFETTFSPDNVASLHIKKYDSAGQLVWQVTKKSTNTIYTANHLVYSNGNLYALSNAYYTVYTVYVMKINPATGANIWTSAVYDDRGSSYPMTGSAIAVDSTGAVVVVGLSTSSNACSFAVKFTSSGAKQWIKQWGPNGSTANFVTTDASNNIYVACDYGTPNNTAHIVKLSASGTLIQSHSITKTSNTSNKALDIQYKDNTLVVGLHMNSVSAVASQSSIIAVLPTDASKLGTYADITYTALPIGLSTPVNTQAYPYGAQAFGTATLNSTAFASYTETAISNTLTVYSL